MTKRLPDIIKNDPIGTIFKTEEVFGSEGVFNDALGESVRFVGIIGVFEGSNEVLMKLKTWAKDFDINNYEDGEGD